MNIKILSALCVLWIVAAPAVAQTKNYIQSPSGSRLGYTIERGTKIEAYAANGARLGYYDARTNKTHDRTGRIIARGNTVAALIVCK